MTSGRYRGLLDVVIASNDFPPVDVAVDQSGLSEHKLVQWTIPVASHPPA